MVSSFTTNMVDYLYSGNKVYWVVAWNRTGKAGAGGVWDISDVSYHIVKNQRRPQWTAGKTWQHGQPAITTRKHCRRTISSTRLPLRTP